VMLHSAFAVDKTRDIDGGREDADIRPLDARSLALSALLGTHPPRLPARALVALAELFGIADGTMRTALSRMVRNGEVLADDGWYRLAGPLLERQRAQDTGRRPVAADWDGRWHTVVTTAERRSAPERRAFRRTMIDHRMGEVRPETWMRPANLPAPEPDDGWILVTGTLAATDPHELVARMWDLDAIAILATRLGERLDSVIHTGIGTSTAEPTDTEPDVASIPARFAVAAAVLRFLRAEPLLPPSLVGDDWPVDRLRLAYAEAEDALQRSLRAFFRAHAGEVPAD
jgi:phenylacetic acid degradation operon negative regulatory protein